MPRSAQVLERLGVAGLLDHDRVHHGRLTAGQIPADVLYGARKMEAR